MTLVLLAVAWTAYCALHSAMISETVTSFVKRRLGDGFRFYRVFFDAVALVTLVPLVLYSVSIEEAPFFRWDGALRPLRYTLVAVGVLLLIAGGRHYSMGQFFGISQLHAGSGGGLAAQGTIDSKGVLGLIRHPWYTAIVLLLWARDLDAVRLVANSILTLYVVVGAHLEERRLVHEFGDGYAAYQRRVSMFFPWRWLISRASR